MKTIKHKRYTAAFLFAASILLGGCEKYLDNTQLPADTIYGENVYNSDYTTSGVVTSVLINLNSSGPFSGNARENAAYTLGLYTDETKALRSNDFADTFYKNAIQVTESAHWTPLYKQIYVLNSVIEGINASKANLNFKNQWLGETYFLRAFCYFYLTNIYGDVPLALTSDYQTNNKLNRSPQPEVYKQMISDLQKAQELLGDSYRDGFGSTTSNRVRPNKAVATALLSRVYLYAKDWANAEAQATNVISNSNYQLAPLGQAFLSGSKETILALASSTPKTTSAFASYNNGMPATLTATQGPTAFSVYSSMSDFQLMSFEPADARYTSWVRKVTQAASATKPAVDYYFPDKYKMSTPNAEYEVLLRLAEQYLIRAEARAMQNKAEAAADLNIIRNRAGLEPTSATGQQALLAAIAKERRVELFSEGGHRFFDLKRTGSIDAVMAEVAPTKGTTWKSYMALWPIPKEDVLQNPNITPNPGYIQ